MRLTVVGGGAIGGTIAACAARGGRSVVLVDNDHEHVARIRRHGIAIDGVEQFVAEVDARTPEQMRDQVDVAVLTVKSQQIDQASEQLRPWLAPGGCVVTLQNGLAAEKIARVLGGERVLPGSVSFAGERTGPGQIHWGARGAVHVGEFSGPATARTRRVAELLSPVGEVVADDDVWGFIWSKLSLAAVLSATALDGRANAEIYADPRCRMPLTAVAGEVAACAHHHGIRLQPIKGVELETFATWPVLDTARVDEAWNRLTDLAEASRDLKPRSGAYANLVAGQKTETRWLLDPVVARRRELGYAAPALEALIEATERVERHEAQMSPSLLMETLRPAADQVASAGQEHTSEEPRLPDNEATTPRSTYLTVPMVRADVRTIYGVRSRYLEAGEGDALLLVHGGGVGGSGQLAFWRVVPTLAAGRRVIVPDLLWSGGTDKPDLPYSFRAQVDHLVGLTDTLGLEKVTLLGQSIGAYIVAKYACEYPDRVDRLVLVGSNTVAMMMGIDVRAETWDADKLENRVDDAEAMRQTLGTLIHRKDLIDDDTVQAYLRCRRAPGVREARQTMVPFVKRLISREGSLFQEVSLTNRLPALSIPVCVIWGRDDEFAPVQLGRELRKLMPRAVYHEIPDAGHHVFHDQPEAFCGHVLRFLAGTKDGDQNTSSAAPQSPEANQGV